MHVCVHVCMIFVGVGGRVRVCVTQRITLGIIPQEQSTLFSVTVSHRTWSSAGRQGWLTSKLSVFTSAVLGL